MDSLKLAHALDHGHHGGELDPHAAHHQVNLHDQHHLHLGHGDQTHHLPIAQSMELLPIPNLDPGSVEVMSQSVDHSLDHSLNASAEEEDDQEELEDEDPSQDKGSRKRRQDSMGGDEDSEFSQSGEDRAAKRGRTRLSESGGAAVGPGKDKFEERLKDLVLFKEKYGHCRVPQVWKENKKLGQWVASMRNLKKAGKLPEDRQKILEGLGFVWCCRNVSTHKGGEKRKMVPWVERFEELKLFKDKYGHCNVPHKWKENIKLSNWMYCQRSFHRHGKLSKEKIKKLESIGFEWSKQDPVLIKRKSSMGDGLVEQGLQPSEQSELPGEDVLAAGGVEGVGVSGVGVSGVGVAVPGVDNGQVNNGVPGQIPDLIDAEIGMNTSVEGGPVSEIPQVAASASGDLRKEEDEEVDYQVSSVKERKSWMERFEELKAFKEKHGNCNVPWKWKENLPLFYWVRRMKDKKRAGALSEERVAMMEEIGFEWVKGQNKERERRKQHQALIEQKRKQLKQEREQQLQQGGAIPVQVTTGVGVVGDALQLHQHAQLQGSIPFELQATALPAEMQTAAGLAYPASFAMTTAGVGEAGGSPTSAAMLSQFSFSKLYGATFSGLPPGFQIATTDNHLAHMASLPMQFLGALPPQVMNEVTVVSMGEEHHHHHKEDDQAHVVHDHQHEHHSHEEHEVEVAKMGDDEHKEQHEHHQHEQHEHQHEHEHEHEHHAHEEEHDEHSIGLDKKDNEGVVDELVEAHSHM